MKDIIVNVTLATPAAEWRHLASYLFSEARVVEAPQQRSLEGNRLTQVPEHTLGLRYQNPALFNASATARYVGGQFDADENFARLGEGARDDEIHDDVVAERQGVGVVLENLFDTTYATGRAEVG